MTKRGRVGVLCFGLGFAASVGSSCYQLETDGVSCGCAEQTELPEYEGSAPIQGVTEYGMGALSPAPGLGHGSITLTDRGLTISYTNEGADYVVRYAITEASLP